MALRSAKQVCKFRISWFRASFAFKHGPAAHAHRAATAAPPVEPLSLALYNGRALAYGLLCRRASDSARSSLPASDTAFRYVGRARRSADDRSNLARDFSLFVAFPYGCRPSCLTLPMTA